MRLLIIPAWYPTQDDPVRGCFFREQAQALAKSGHTVSVFAYYADEKKGVRVEKTRTGERMTEYAIHYKTLPVHLTYFRLVKAMSDLIKAMPPAEKPELIHAHSFQAVKYAAALKKKFRLPLAVTEHATWFQRGLLSGRDLAGIRRDYSHADALIAVSRGLGEILAPLYPGELRVIPNIISDVFFDGDIARRGGTPFRFIAVGAMDPKKGIDILLRAFAALINTGGDALLTVCGGGARLRDYTALARDLGVEDRVRFTGQLSRAEIVRELEGADAFVLPSRTETFGVVYGEAMAKGLPIIMTKTNAWRELVTAETGLAVEIENTDALARAMKQMLESGGAYNGETIRSLCRDRFSEESVCGRLSAVYSGLIESCK